MGHRCPHPQPSAPGVVRARRSGPAVTEAGQSCAETFLAGTNPAGRRRRILLRDLPDPGAGRAYQLWLIRGAEPARSVGLLTAGARESTTVIGPVAAAGTFGVSNEPAGGSSAPTRIVGLVTLS
ncbi:anti-sigma factor [Micromonospora sp. NPDC049114]|uniref:anti-sigma factor n=1 Tax=Micromonospora sp. NPDC049114 TaxID=3155498 RepID=UPI0033C03131